MAYSMRKFIKIQKYDKHIQRIILKSSVHYETNKIISDKRFRRLEEKYNWEEVENSVSKSWNIEEKYKYDVNEKNSDTSNVFSIALPPPNVTGSLHLGHALTATLQDVLCRFKRLNGLKVCWLPGFDHAGIATQVVVEKYLAKRNVTRQQLGYEKFRNEVWKWKNKNEGNIKRQLKSLGASLDWSKEVFTMDDKQTTAVKEAFIRLFDDGLIFRSNNLVNWSCALNSSISDIEVNSLEVSNPTDVSVPGYDKKIKLGLLYEIAYKFNDSSDEIIIATTRPETLLGDVAVAVHPDDSRYTHMIGKRLKHPFSDRSIPVIADESVEMNFGTGALKITPAHDRNDYSLAEKHNLEMLPIINESGMIEEGFSVFSGMKRYKARELMLNELMKKNLLRCIKEHKMIVPICSRSGDIVELLPRPQWYLNCSDMNKNALEYVKNKKLQLIPNNYERVWSEWLNENKNWCISRQLWWGHRIPAYNCHVADHKIDSIWVAALNEDDAKLKASKILNANSSEITCIQDNDVLDTWFSSAIYPFSSHGWPSSSDQFKQLYPLSLMVTGHDITFFWVSRMIMLGSKLTGVLPFSKVLLHGIICDAKGVKMSKSKGNVLEPEHIMRGISLNDLQKKTENSNLDGILSDTEMMDSLKQQKNKFPQGIPACGADALRFTLCTRNVKNSFIQFDIDDCIVNKSFCNKIWQSLKFTQNIVDMVSDQALSSCSKDNLDSIDLWLLSRLSTMVQSVYDSLNNYDFHIATMSLKQFLYFDLCDVYIECVKMNMRPDFDDGKMAAHCHIFSASFNTALRLLSPFMPYLSEKLIQCIPIENNCLINYEDSAENLMIRDANSLLSWKNEEIEEEIETVMKIVSTVRQMKVSYNIPKKVKPLVYVKNIFPENDGVVNKYCNMINHLSVSENLSIIEDETDLNLKIWSYTTDGRIKVYLKLSNSEEEDEYYQIGRMKYEKELEKIQKSLEKLEKKVSAEGFAKTPMDVQISLKSKISALKDKLKTIHRSQIQ